MTMLLFTSLNLLYNLVFTQTNLYFYLLYKIFHWNPFDKIKSCGSRQFFPQEIDVAHTG